MGNCLLRKTRVTLNICFRQVMLKFEVVNAGLLQLVEMQELADIDC